MISADTLSSALSLKSYASAIELYEGLAIYIEAAAKRAIIDRGCFSIAITGGQTVLPLYRRLRKIETDWQSWHIFWTDERCVPVDAPERNSRVAFDAWLGQVSIAADNVSIIPAELGPNEGAQRYAESLACESGFDMVLLSLGEDGHVASIFPSRLPDPLSSPSAVPVVDAPKHPPERVSLSLARLADCRELILIAIGAGKSAALAQLSCSNTQPAALLAKTTSMEIWTDIVDGNLRFRDPR